MHGGQRTALGVLPSNPHFFETVSLTGLELAKQTTMTVKQAAGCMFTFAVPA